MQIWSKSQHIESVNRLIASLPQARAQVIEIKDQNKTELSSVDYGEILITVIKGNGIIKTKDDKYNIEQDDQIHLVEGDEFALLTTNQCESFIAQIFWAPNIIELLS